MAKETVRRLGRGLNSLISSTVESTAEDEPGSGGISRDQVKELPLEQIVPNRYQPRLDPERSDLKELAESIRRVGVLQPVTVRVKGDNYELVMGERRWRAAQLAGLTRIPALVREVSEERMLEEALIENLQREDLTPIDRADG